MVRYYYPAESEGRGTTPDPSSGPYPTVIYLPGAGGNRESYPFGCEHLASWGVITMSIDINWGDPFSGNVADIEDLLDHLEVEDGDSGSVLYQMVDEDAFGICGHSAGGRLALVDGPQVDRIRAVQTLAAAVGSGTVDALATIYDVPVLLQVGKLDQTYIAGSRRAFEKFPEPVSLWEIYDSHHTGPFAMQAFASFFLYHLGGDTEYKTYVYGSEAVGDAASGYVDLKFKLHSAIGYFFPPEVSATVSVTTLDMDQQLTVEATVRGYQRPGETELVHEWDMDGDGVADISNGTDPNMTYVYTRPGTFDVVYGYHLGALNITSSPLRVVVSNVAPVAVAGPDVTVDQDSFVQLDGGDSHDTPSDKRSLQYKWEFSDGFATNFTAHTHVSRQLVTAGTVVAVLSVRDTHGAVGSDSVNITVRNVPPTAFAGQNLSTTEDSEVGFLGEGSDTPSDEDDLRYRWDFGDGFGTDWSTELGALHAYTISGIYTATFHVKDPSGAVSTSDVSITVGNVLPTCSITTPAPRDGIMEDANVEFTAEGEDTPSDVQDLAFMWDFGDGTTTDWLEHSDATTVHTYTSSGSYRVILVVQDDDGGEGTADVRVSVLNVPPTAHIIRPSQDATVDEDSLLVFQGMGTDTPSDEGGLSYSWEIDGRRYRVDRVEVSFPASGRYMARFTVADGDGDEGSAWVNVTVVNLPPDVIATLEPRELLLGEPVMFTSQGVDTPSDRRGLRFDWDFGDGGSSSNVNGTHVYEATGDYTITLIVTDDDGETVSRTFQVTVGQRPVVPPGPSNGDGESGGSDGVVVASIAGLAIVCITVAGYLLFTRVKGKG